MKKWIWMMLLCVAAAGVQASAVHTAIPGQGEGEAMLSKQTRMSLLTASPGQELYSLFGHSALRVIDPVRGIDEVYNWGTFDFDTPGFYMKFIRGRLLYELSVTSFRGFLREYDRAGRGVVEQWLGLYPQEMEAIYRFLQWNRLPENLYYTYDFFFDNCATRIRDVLDNYLEVEWGPDPYAGQGRSFRDLLQPYLAGTPWAAFGIDLVLGASADRRATPWEYMYLPDEMYVAFANAGLWDGRSLVAEEGLVLRDRQEPLQAAGFRPAHLTWLVFLLGVLTLFRQGLGVVFDRFYFTALGVFGLMMCFLWFVSDHQATNYNLNLLWALPSHLYFIYHAHGRHHVRLTMLYFGITALIGLLLVALWNILPQAMHAGFVPLIGLAALKSWRIARTMYMQRGL